MNHVPWLQTLGGGDFDLCNPKPEQINLRHMARVLARISRFGGHTEGPTERIYSVAQHQIEGAAAILRDTGREDAATAFKLHDGHEYVLGDRATPVAEAQMQVAAETTSCVLPHVAADIVKRSWSNLKTRIDRAIYARAGVPYPLAPDVAAIVREYDIRMCRTERDSVLLPVARKWVDAVENAEPVKGCDFYLYRPGTIERLYIASLRESGIDP